MSLVFVMRKEQRLRKSKDFVAVRREGRSWANRLLVLGARPNGLGVTRFGFSISKRVGKAVVRNKVKRRLREAARLANVRNGWDIVFIVRKDASVADYHRLDGAMRNLLDRANLLCYLTEDADVTQEDEARR